MGILGNLRRDRDGHIMHANIDVDVIVSEAPPDASDDAKPLEAYDVVENFLSRAAAGWALRDGREPTRGLGDAR